jgi:Lar family restriction alleviation protein
MSETTLLPCPFCGGEAKAYGVESLAFPSMKLCRVSCDGCHASTSNHASRPDAIAAWNTRAVAQPETPTPDALDAAVDRQYNELRDMIGCGDSYTDQRVVEATITALVTAVEARAVARERARECAWTPAKSGVKNRKVTGCHNIITCDYPITVRCDFCGGRVRVESA